MNGKEEGKPSSFLWNNSFSNKYVGNRKKKPNFAFISNILCIITNFLFPSNSVLYKITREDKGVKNIYGLNAYHILCVFQNRRMKSERGYYSFLCTSDESSFLYGNGRHFILRWHL